MSYASLVTNTGLAENVTVDSAAVLAFSAAMRGLVSTILNARQNAAAITWNQQQHPRRSGVDPSEILAALANYVDMAAVNAAISAYNVANPSVPITLGTAPIDAAFAEAVHQFQAKCFFEPGQADGKAGEATLDSLGLIARSGMNQVDHPNTKAQNHLNTLGSRVSTATSGEFTSATWYSFMVNPSFLGWRFTHGVHVVLVRKLRIAEQYLLSLPAYAGMTPVELGRALGMGENHHGARPSADTASMHTLGLAADLNYSRNPWVGGAHDEAEANRHFTVAFKRAVLLVSGVTLPFSSVAAYLDGLGTSGRSTASIYDELALHSAELGTYARLRDDDSRLRQILNQRQIDGTAGVFASGETIEAAVHRWHTLIAGDVRNLIHGNFGARRDPRNGFLNLSRDLVIALRDHACLAWGAVDFGPHESGDMMHFDCRTEGVGRVVNRGFQPTQGHPCLRDASATGRRESAAFGEAVFAAGREELRNVSLLGRHRGTQPDLILRWNDMPDTTTEVDVAVHLHGYSDNRERMSLVHDKEPASGLDFRNPADAADGTPGRTQPTLAILPRGNYFGGDSGKGYNFPALVSSSALHDLIDFSLERFATRSGMPKVRQRRLIVTAHSGGGAALLGILQHNDPHEVHIFDALYSSQQDSLLDWLRRHIRSDIAALEDGTGRNATSYMPGQGGALRVFYIGDTRTEQNSLAVQRAIYSELPASPRAGAGVAAWYRVERTAIGHPLIPRRYGWRLLADAAANVPDASPPLARSVKRAAETSGPPPDELESVSGPCPDVPVPPSRRPRVLVQDSVHSAVREAQRKLNAFHAYRLAAGLPGLRDAPLEEDCTFGRHTFAAVKSFQELVFPGMPIEHDGKIGSHTWAQLDAVAVGPGLNPAAQLSVAQLRITDDAFSGPLSWDQVIGLDTTTVNLELIASGLPPATMPAQIRVELSSRVANRASGSATLGTPVKLDVPRFGPDPANPNRIVYRTNRRLADVGDFLKVERSIKEVATIVRSGGTSDAAFRRALGWNPRGIATQPIAAGASTGAESSETPDAFALFRSAGVEVLEVRVPAQPNWRVPGAIKRLIRSPADVVYYSGHGLSVSGKLAIDIENKPCGEHGTYRDWLGPSDLAPVWINPMDLNVLILAGCSVLKIDFSTSPPSGTGLDWARLLAAKGGPLVALLGYQRAAPCDSPNGDKIAKAMAERMARGSTNFAKDWLEVNGDNNANNAVAMDARGYWWIEGTMLGGFDIKGPKPIP